MDMMNGLLDALQLINIFYVFVGVGLGIIVGAIPGLSGPITIAMLISLTYYMPAIGAIGFLVGINKGGCFGGSISAILLNTPGAPEAVATTFDGYPMNKKGKGLKALKVSLLSSTFGDLFSTLLVIVVAGFVASFALKMGPPEITAILFLALTVIAALESESFINGIIVVCIGLLFSCVGMDPLAAMPRLTFNMYQLESGIAIAPLGIGMLAVAEIVRQCICLNEEECAPTLDIHMGSNEDNKLSAKEIGSLVPTWIKSSLIGSFIGSCPGIGSTIASFLSYGVTKKSAKENEKFGEGEIKGVAAPEAANNAVVGASLIPLFTLGIPGSVAATFLIGAFIIHGITPGPLMFEENTRAVYGIYGSMLVGNVLTLVLGYIGLKVFVKVLSVPKSILYPIILMICIMGAYIIESDPAHVYLMVFFFALGFIMRLLKLSFVAFLIGFVLGKQLEMALQQTLISSDSGLLVLFTRPGSGTIMAIAIIFILYTLYKTFYPAKKVENV